jgi:hypothetical protein
MVAVTELLDRLAMIKLLDAAIGPIKTRDRGFTGGQLLVGLACAQLAGEDFLVGLDRYRADTAGQLLAAVPGLCSTTAAGLSRRLSDAQWRAVETGIGDVAAAALQLLPASRSAALCQTVTAVQIVVRGAGGVQGGRSCPSAQVATLRASARMFAELLARTARLSRSWALTGWPSPPTSRPHSPDRHVPTLVTRRE